MLFVRSGIDLGVMCEQDVTYTWDDDAKTILRIDVPHKLQDMQQMVPIAQGAVPYITSQPHTVHAIWNLHQPPIVGSRDARADFLRIYNLQPDNLRCTIFVGLKPHQKLIAKMFNRQFSSQQDALFYVDTLAEARALLNTC